MKTTDAPGVLGQVKRYRIHGDHEGGYLVVPDSQGNWVRYDDIRALAERVPEGMVLVPRDALGMLLHKFERAGGPWKVAERGIELGAASWASNVENSLVALAEAATPQVPK
jgi:hypothetical protein